MGGMLIVGLSLWSACQSCFKTQGKILTSHARFRTIRRPACEAADESFSSLFLSTHEMTAPLYVWPCSLEIDC
jgi:hypothetical protein